MRRASVVGPLILILIGVVFLARNMFPELPLLDFLSRYWPFLLIGWGALRLIEILFWAANSKPLPQRGMGGGEWVLVVFLVLIGSAIWEGHRGGWLNRGNIRIGGLEMFGEAFDYPIAGEKTGVGKTPEIVIEGFRGNARIAGSNTSDVKVTGRKTVRALAQDAADRANQETKFEIVTNGNQVIIRTNQDRAANSSRVSEDLEITVPKGSSLNAAGRYGDFDINDLDGGVEITSDNAGVRMQNVGGNVRIETRRSDVIRAVNVKGSVDLKGRGTDLELQSIDGPVTISASYVGMVQFRALSKPVRYEAQNTEFVAEKIPGQLRMTLSDLNASNLVGPIRLQARSKDVTISDFTQSADITIDRGDVELRPGNAPLGKIEVHTRSGAIELAIPEKAKFDLNASTDRGEITNDYGGNFRAENSGRGATLKGNVDDGPRVNLTTNHGNITVRKSTGTEQTTVFPSTTEVPRAPQAPKAPEGLKPVEQ
jgi:DUF4097 and DUF4098 domain-containing protein YvlB